MDSLLRKNFKASKDTVVGWEYKNEKEFLKQNKDETEDNELKMVKDGREWNLHSRVDMESPVDIWCEQFLDKNISYTSIFLIYGFGHKRYIEKLIEKYPDNAVFVYEPFQEVLIQQMKMYDMTELLKNEKLIIFTGDNRFEMWRKYVGSIISYDNYHDLICGVLPNYIKADEDEYKEFKETIEYCICNEVESMRMKVAAEENRGRNFLYNCNDFIHQAGIKELKDAFAKHKFDDYPAVVVSAGPSLENNVEELARYKGKAFIIGLNASLKVLRKHNITPDIMLSYDAKISDFTPFENEEINHIPLLTNITSDYRVVRANKSRRFYDYENNEYIGKLAGELNVKLIRSESGGCVANAAFAFAQRMGFNNIILIGQDLAYTNNKIHAGQRADKNDIDINEKEYVMVKGVYEDEVPTDRILCLYKKWFEERIADSPDLNVINATEGGAYIEGATHMTLKEALEKYCVGTEIDFRKIVDDSGMLFSDRKRKKALEIIHNSEMNIDNEKKALLDKKRIYERLDTLNRKQKYHTSEFKKCIKESGEVQKYIEESKEMELIQLFVNNTELFVKNKMREKETTAYDEIKLAVDSGKELIDGYVLACDKLKEAWDEVHRLIEEE